MKLGIVGTSRPLSEREITDARKIIAHLIKHFNYPTVVSGGATSIDCLAFHVAESMGCETELFIPKVPRWEGGYKERNLKIAQVSDVVVCLTTNVKTQKCYHHSEIENHQKTAGCWTMVKAVKLGKEGRLYII